MIEKRTPTRYFTTDDVKKIIDRIISSHMSVADQSNGRLFKVKPVQVTDDEIESAFVRAARQVSHRGE